MPEREPTAGAEAANRERINVVALYADMGRAATQHQIDPSDLGWFQATVSGYVEALDLPGAKANLYINEDGISEGLPVNHLATAALWLYNQPFRFGHFVLGDAVLLGQPDTHGNDTSVPTDLAELLTSDRGKVVEAQRIVTGRWVPLDPPFDDFLDAAVYAMEMSTETGVNDVRLRLAEEQGQRAGDV